MSDRPPAAPAAGRGPLPWPPGADGGTAGAEEAATADGTAEKEGPGIPALGWRRRDGLGFRLSSILALALLPLGLLGLVTAAAWRDAAEDQAGAALLGETLGAAAPAVGLIREAQGTAAALALAVPAVAGEEARCTELMTEVRRRAPQYSVAAYVPASGLMTCASDGARFDYSDTPLFRQMQAEGFPAKVYVQARGPVSGTSVVLVVQPVLGPDGAPLGYVGLALPHAALRRAEEVGQGLGAGEQDLPAPDFATFNGDGAVLTTSRGFGAEALMLPAGEDLAALGRGGAGVFRARTAAGEARAFAVAPVVPGALYALGSRPVRQAFALGPVAAATPFLFTTLMWGGSLAVAWAAAHLLVTRHMHRLARAITDFAAGRRDRAPPGLARAPAEVREVAEAFAHLTRTIERHEAELEAALHEREALLREVNHRTRNNLQLIASIINMQARRVRSEEAKGLLRWLQERVLSLATVHRELYSSIERVEVGADELLGGIARQVVNARALREGLAGRAPPAPRLEVDLHPLPLGPDRAVPLALLVTEALGAAMARLAPDAAEPRLRLGLAVTGSAAELVLEASPARGGPAQPGPEALGEQLVAAFAAQVGGRLAEEEEASAWRLRVTFPARADAA